MNTKSITILYILIFLSGCSTTLSRSLIEICRGALAAEDNRKFYFAVKYIERGIVDIEGGITKNKVYDILDKVELKSDNANLKRLTEYHKCVKNLSSSNAKDNISDIDLIVDKYVKGTGKPIPFKNKSWFLGWHYNDWTIEYSVSFSNSSPYNVNCVYQISGCPDNESQCVSPYKTYERNFVLEESKGKIIQDLYKFEYNGENPPIHQNVQCIEL